MSQGPVRLSVATNRAWSRMTQILFSPFDAGKWFVLGFTAWLAMLIEGCGSSGSGGGGGGDFSEDSETEGDSPVGGDIGSLQDAVDWDQAKKYATEGYETAIQWMQDNPVILMLIGGLVLFAILFVIVLFWVQCRGKFMFLDNVVHDRALVSYPWSEYKREGNSLFWWSIGFGIVTFLISLVFLGAAGWTAYTSIQSGEWSQPPILILVGLGCFFAVYVLLLAYIKMLLEDYVIPLMHRHRLTTTKAWFHFLPLHNRQMFRFVLFGLWKILLTIASVIVIAVIGFGTCCIGFLLMAIPYIGAVFLLPMTTFFRSLGLEYLAQFGEEWDVFPGGRNQELVDRQ